MALTGGKFFIQDKLITPGLHHASFKALWETKWREPCAAGLYPFMFGAIQDFEPVVKDIIQKDLKEPYNWDEYASCFFPKAEELVTRAIAAENSGEREKASELYLRASAVYRIARFPILRSEKQRHAWNAGKEAARKGLELHEFPMVQVDIPHIHAQQGDGHVLPGFYHLPAHASASNKVPLVIIFTGLDGYRTELAVWKEGFRQVGCATLVVEIPGTGDNPAAPADPTSPDRLWTSMFDWVRQQDGIDQTKVVNWGFSTGGYYSIRLAHTHKDQVKGAVAHGGGCHFMFDPFWLDHADHLEYPFDLSHSLCHKYGYGTDFERFKKEASGKFSLLEDGTLKKDCTRLLLVNGVGDEIFPVDDYYLCLLHGMAKEARFVPDKKHMGEPESFGVILRWISDLLDLNIDIKRFMSTIPSRPKY
ncbi:Alpha/Beta hydrolase protein [Pestalotiopsis sp. NC0098]|nr:Alpha/Beta hydrolase protein [Pestalotiopsis sp. NC0098]